MTEKPVFVTIYYRDLGFYYSGPTVKMKIFFNINKMITGTIFAYW